jgi:hypothetical protein
MQNWLQLDIKEKPLAGEGDEGSQPQPFNWLFDNNPLLKDIDQDKLSPEQAQQKRIPVTHIKIAPNEYGYLLDLDGESIQLNHGDILECGDKHVHVHYITPAKERMPEVMMHPDALTSFEAAHVITQQQPAMPSIQHELPQQNNVLLPMTVITPEEQVHDPLAFLDAGKSAVQNHAHHPMSFYQASPSQNEGSFVPTRAAFSTPVYHQPRPTNHPDLSTRASEQSSLLADLPQPSTKAQALKDQFAPMHSVSPNLSVTQSPLEAIDDLFESQFHSSDQPVSRAQEPKQKQSFLSRLKQRFHTNL